MNRLICSCAATLVAATPFTMQAADAPEELNRFSLGARFGMNFKGSFRNNTVVVPPPAPPNPGPASGGVNHLYDDGYVLVDSSGNFGGTTWNWGYQNASQVVGGGIQYSVTASTPPTIAPNRNVTDNPQFGTELTYQRIVGPLPFLSARWGLEGAVGFTDLDLHDNRNGAGLTTVTTDIFPVPAGVIPPGAPYNGTFAGPGALLGDTPFRTTVFTIDSLSSRQKLTGQLYSLRLGPFAECYVTPKLSLAASVGLTLAPSSVDYDFAETKSINGVVSATAGHVSKTELLYGPYVSALLRYDICKRWGVYVGAQFQSLTDMSLSIGARTATLNQRATVYGVAGISWTF